MSEPTALPSRMTTVAAELAALADLLRADAARVARDSDGWAARVFIRQRHADELAGAARMLTAWAGEIAGEGE